MAYLDAKCCAPPEERASLQFDNWQSAYANLHARDLCLTSQTHEILFEKAAISSSNCSHRCLLPHRSLVLLFIYARRHLAMPRYHQHHHALPRLCHCRNYWLTALLHVLLKIYNMPLAVVNACLMKKRTTTNDSFIARDIFSICISAFSECLRQGRRSTRGTGALCAPHVCYCHLMW